MSKWGFAIPHQGTVSVGTASVQVRAANPNRKYLLLTNHGTVPVFIAAGQAAVVAGGGARLSANGGHFEMSRGQGNVYSGALNGIASVADQAISYLEGE